YRTASSRPARSPAPSSPPASSRKAPNRCCPCCRRTNAWSRRGTTPRRRACRTDRSCRERPPCRSALHRNATEGVPYSNGKGRQMTHDDVLSKLRERFGAGAFTTSEFRDNRRVHVAPELLFEVMRFLKEACHFDMLVELSAADYLHYPDAKDRY